MVKSLLKRFDERRKNKRLRKFQSKRKLLKPEEFVEAILENLPAMIFIKDAKELRFVRFNKAGEELLGMSRTEMLGKNDYDFFPRDQADFFTNKDRNVLKGFKAVDIPEEPINTQSRGQRWLHTKKIPLIYLNGEPQYLLGISIDITDIKIASDRLRQFNLELESKVKERTLELEKANEKLMKINRDMDNFIYMVSHDLKTPLANMEGLFQMLEESSPCQDPENIKIMNMATKSLDRLKEIIKGLTNLIQAQKNVTGETEEIMPAQIIDEVKETLKEIILHSEARINVDVRGCAKIKFSARDFRSLIYNLLTNALKYRLPDKAPVVDITLSLKGEYFVLSIKDNGLGLSAEQINKLFVMFQRFHPHIVEGTGLGLYLVKQIVDNHDGKIDVKSEPGKGANFILYLKTECPS